MRIYSSRQSRNATGSSANTIWMAFCVSAAAISPRGWGPPSGYVGIEIGQVPVPVIPTYDFPTLPEVTLISVFAKSEQRRLGAEGSATPPRAPGAPPETAMI